MKKQIFGAILLSAALAVGTCVPAFAAPTVGPATDATTVDALDTASTDGVSTTVKVSTHISQINVTLPMTLPMVADQAGGDAVTPNNYYIQNMTRSNLAIDNIAWAITDTHKADWNIGRNTGIAAAAAPTAYAVADAQAVTTPAYGTLALELAPVATGTTMMPDGTTARTNVSGTGVSGSGVNVVGTAANTLSGSQKNVDWLIGKTDLASGNITMTNGNKMYIDVNASTSAISQKIDLADAQDVIRIVYTVKAA